MTTITVVPVQRSVEEKLRSPAKLATTMLEVLAAGAADAGRFQRGRAYARDGAVGVLHVSTGRLEAEVSGSRAGAYEVTIHTVLAADLTPDSPFTPSSLMPFVPEADDVRYDCTCPDGERPCKHAVAALLAFAAEVGDRPELLRTWRVGASPRARLSSAKTAPTPRPGAAAVPAVDPWELPEWRAYLGTDPDAPAPSEIRDLFAPLPPEPARFVGNVDAAALLDSARATLARHVESLRELRHR